MKKVIFATCLVLGLGLKSPPDWGFYGHRQINRLAVFTLPPEMILFYKKNIVYITEASVNPDRRRFSMPDEAPRHYLDLDHFGDSALHKMPRFWDEAVALYSEDTLKAYGILPWYINRMYYRLRDAFRKRDPSLILKLSAELGHYIADAHVPLHTTENYNGQLTGQEGIHAFWESRLPELFCEEYDFFVGRAYYIPNVQLEAWRAIEQSHAAVDSVLRLEKDLAKRFGESRYAFETKGRQTAKVFSRDYAAAYHAALSGMVERRMRAAILTVGSFWYTAWIEAGQPDLRTLIGHEPDEAGLRQSLELEPGVQEKFNTREHEGK